MEDTGNREKVEGKVFNILVFSSKVVFVVTFMYFGHEELFVIWCFFSSSPKSSLLMTSLFFKHEERQFMIFKFYQKFSLKMTSLFFRHEKRTRSWYFYFPQKSSLLMTTLYFRHLIRQVFLFWSFSQKSSLLMTSLYTLGTRNDTCILFYFYPKVVFVDDVSFLQAREMDTFV